MKSKIVICLATIASCLLSCNTKKNLSGTYHSNFAVNGFFVTIIRLQSDSTFSYRTRGDLMFDTSGGYYQVRKKHVILHHEPFKLDSEDVKKYGREMVLMMNALSTNKHLKYPEPYRIGRNKLFVCDSTGKTIQRAFGYSKRRQFLLFGSHWFKRRYFLIKQKSTLR